MEQPVNMNTVSENQEVCAYKKALRMIREIARDLFDETYPCLERVIEEYSKMEMVLDLIKYKILKYKIMVIYLI